MGVLWWAVDVGREYLAWKNIPDFCKVTFPFYFSINVQ